ncbi:MAG: hypothetical protein ACE5EH_12970 [Gammaproteobacteria bacterium]
MKPEQRDMSQYATRTMIGWAIVIICAVMGSLTAITSAQVESLIDANNKTFSARDGAQDRKVEFTEKRVERLEVKQEKDHELIKNVQTRLQGIETALEFLVEKAKKK